MADQIQDLNPNVPVGSSPVSGGDEEFRQIKLAIQNSFPGMTDAWRAELTDIFFRDGLFRTLTITDQILSAPQVAISLFSFNGADGSINGNGYGIVGGARVAEGQYEFTITDNIGASIEGIIAGSANLGLGLLVMNGFRDATTANQINVFTNEVGNGAFADCTNGYVIVFDAERV